jgi:uncharacterized membrane protein
MPLAYSQLPVRRQRGDSLHAVAASSRLASIDVVRGIVMVLMAIDHVRVYAGVPAGGPTAGVFFTRWVTHFCAPAFVFLAGTSAFLYGRRFASPAPLARYLATRGLILVALELTLIRFFWTFNLDYAHYLLAGVIWMLGISMTLLAAMVFLPLSAITTIALVIVFGHNVTDLIPAEARQGWQESGGLLLQLVYFGGFYQLGGDGTVLAVLYSIVPWVGVMAAGYACGAICVRDRRERDRWCTLIGGGAIALFVLLRAFNLYGDPRPWGTTGSMPALFQFLNTAKYPASLLFLLMTLGPTIALLPVADRARGRAADVLAVFGRVPMFYYLLHIPVIHLSAMLVSLLRAGRVDPWLFANHPMMPPPVPRGYAWSLPLPMSCSPRLSLCFTGRVGGLRR